MKLPSCRLCGASALVLVEGFDSLKTVTSDCRPCAHSARLACCTACGAVQKVADSAWRAAVSDIYAAYEPYHQAGGSEQRVFDASGASSSRSERFLSFVLEQAELGKTGSHLDIGCGNGKLLATMHGLLPGWQLSGHELGEAQREQVLGVPGVEEFYSGPLADIGLGGKRFDLITMVHVLEHVEAPAAFLKQATALLSQGGVIAIEVPDWSQNPFDLLIFDHCTHFGASTLQNVSAAAGLAGAVRSDQVPKELSGVFRPGTTNSAVKSTTVLEDTRMSVQGAVDDLVMTRDQMANTANTKVGVFGTAIAATWLAGEWADLVDFFVDENPACVGGLHLGKPVHAPEAVPAGSTVVVPLAPVVARNVVMRMNKRFPDVCWLNSHDPATDK